MDSSRTEGSKQEVEGAVKEVAGKLTGNELREVAGNLHKHIGKRAD